jgi:hypothetical protein
VTVAVGFEFAATLQVGFELDTKGIREAIEYRDPIKALNSFALLDTFYGVDKPMLTLAGSVFVTAEASAVIVQVGVSGGVTAAVTIDLYDPNPNVSGGLVRPYELISTGASALEWFEFGLRIDLFLELYVRVAIKIGWVKITIYKLSKRFTVALIEGRVWNPEIKSKVAALDFRTGVLKIRPNDAAYLTCSGLNGTLADETIECRAGNVYNTFEHVKQLDFPVTRTARAAEGAATTITLRDVYSAANLKSLNVDRAILVYSSTEKLLNNIKIAGDRVVAGFSPVIFGIITTGTIILPQPEAPLLVTTVGANCSDNWTLKGYTNLVVKMSELSKGCHIRATEGKHNRASLILDFGDICKSGYIVTAREDSEGLHVEMREEGAGSVIIKLDEDVDLNTYISVLVGSNFDDIQLKMSNCEDKVNISGGGPHRRQISVYGRDGNDTITITNESPISIGSLMPIPGAGAPFHVVVDAGKGVDKLIQVNHLSSIPHIVPTSLTSSSMAFTKVIFKDDENVQLPHLDYVNVEELDIQSICEVFDDDVKLPEFVVFSTPPPSRHQNQDSQTNIMLEDCTELPAQLEGIKIEGSKGDLNVSLSGGAATKRTAYLNGIGDGYKANFTAQDGEEFSVQANGETFVVTESKSVLCVGEEAGPRCY